MQRTTEIGLEEEENILTKRLVSSHDEYNCYRISFPAFCNYLTIEPSEAKKLLSDSIDQIGDTIIDHINNDLHKDLSFVELSNSSSGKAISLEDMPEAPPTHQRVDEESVMVPIDYHRIKAYFDHQLSNYSKWPQPSLLQALAKLRNVQLQLWQLNGQNRIPHLDNLPLQQQLRQRIDLLYGDNDNILQIEFKERKVTSILKDIINFSAPYTLNSLLINGSFFVNSLVLAQIGENALAASSLISSTQLLTSATAKAILNSTSFVAARNSNNDQVIGTILQQAWMLAVILSVPIVLLYLLSHSIFLLLGQNIQIAAIAGNYLSWYSLALPAILLGKCNEYLALATKHQYLALTTTALNNCGSSFLGYALSLGKFGLPAVGFRGGAFGALIASWLSFFGLLLFFYFHSDFKRYEIFKLHKPARVEMLKLLFLIGLPMGLQVSLEFLYIFVKSIFAGVLGESSLASEQIVSQYSSLILSAAIAIGTINGVLIGRDIANNNSYNVKKIGYISMFSSVPVPLVGLLLFYAIPGKLTNLFVDQEQEGYQEILGLTKKLFLINGINGLYDALKNSSAGALTGFYDTTFPALVMLLSLWLVGVPASLTLAIPLTYGIVGVFLGRLINSMVSTPILVERWRRQSNDPQAAIDNNRIGFLTKFSSIYHNCVTCCEKRYQTLQEEAAPEGTSESPHI